MRWVPVLVLLAHGIAVTSSAAQDAAPLLDNSGDALPKGAIARLGTVRFQPPEYVRTIALSPDGSVLVSAANGDKEGTTRLDFMDTATGKCLRKVDLSEVCDGDRNMLFTPNGKHLAFTGGSKIPLLDVETGVVVTSIDGEGVWNTAITFTNDGKWLAAQPQQLDPVYDAPVCLWDMTTGKQVKSLPGRGRYCTGLTFNSAGNRLLLKSIVPSQTNGKSRGINSDSKVALACIDVPASKVAGETTVAPAQNVALCPDGETVALEDPDHQCVRVRHLPTGAERCVLPVKKAKFAFAPHGKTLLTINQHGQGTLWDPAKGRKIRDLEGSIANKDFRIVGMSKDGKTIAVLDGGWHSAATVVVWNADTGKRALRPPGHSGAITCLAYAPGGNMLASGSLDKTVRLWNPATGEHLREVAVHRDEINAVAFSPDGKLLASSSKDGKVRLTNIADGKLIAEFAGQDRGARALTFAPDGKVLFAGGSSAEVLGWKIAGAREVVRFKAGVDGSVMAFAEGGTLALTANGEIRTEIPARLQVWNPFNKAWLAAMPISNEPENRFGSVRCDAGIFSPDSRMIASSQITEYQDERPFYGAAQLRLWERASGQPILTLAPTITKVLAFSPNGRLLASGGTGESGHLRVGYGAGINVWDTLTGKKAGSLPASPECAAFSPDGLHLATGSRDHTILIWKAPAVQSSNEGAVPSAQQREAWWAALGGQAGDAYKAMGQMIDVPGHAVDLLKVRVQPVQASDPDVVARLIAQLDSRTYAERVQAQIALEKMGEGHAHLLKQAMAGKVSEEVRRRLETLLGKCDVTSAQSLRHHRAVATLEWIGTPVARALLQMLANGAPGARLTLEAEVALKRLQGLGYK